MAGMRAGDAKLKSLQIHVGNLVSATDSLASLLEEEAISLKRRDEVARLQVLRVAIMRHIESTRCDESSSSYSYSAVRAVRSLVGLGARLDAATSNNDRLWNMSQKLFDPLANGEPRFSTVLVCIGLEGVPEDVHVVSVSSQARKSRQKEFRVVEALQKNQNLLLTEENFSELLDRLADKIIEGKLSLPISLQSILQIQESRQLRLCHQNKD